MLLRTGSYVSQVLSQPGIISGRECHSFLSEQHPLHTPLVLFPHSLTAMAVVSI